MIQLAVTGADDEQLLALCEGMSAGCMYPRNVGDAEKRVSVQGR